MGVLKFIGGKPVQWSDLAVSVEGVDASNDLKGLKYGVKAEKEFIYAGGDDPASIQSGNRSYTGTLTLLERAVWVMHDAAIAAGGRDVTDLKFDLTIKYRQAGVRGIRVLLLKGCEISEFEEGMMQNDKEMPVSLPFLYEALVPLQ
jgi:hypothetical protein